MSEFEKPSASEPAPILAHAAVPASHVVLPAEWQPQDTLRPVSDKAWLGVASLCVGTAGVLIVAMVSAVAGLWTFFIAPVVLFLAGIQAIVFGHLGLSDARKKKTRMGVSIAGMIVGYLLIGVVIAMVAIMGFILFVHGAFGASEH